MSRSKRVRKARSAARREKRFSVCLNAARAHLTEATERARFRRQLNESDAPEALKKVLSFLADPIGSLVEEMGKRICQHCLGNGISASLQATVTERGNVMRCWQCGGEYRDGVRVWPEPPDVIQPRVDSPSTNREPQ